MKPRVFHSIRWRVQMWHAVLLVIVLIAFGLTSFEVARRDQLERIDEELENAMQRVFRPAMLRPDAFGKGPGMAFPMPPRYPGPPPTFPPDLDRFAEGQARLRRAIEELDSSESIRSAGYYYVLWDADGATLARTSLAPKNLTRPEMPSLPGSDPRRERARGPGGVRQRGSAREAYRFLPANECLLVGRSIAPDLAEMRSLALKLAGAGCAVLLFGLAGGWWLASRAIRPIEQISDAAVRIATGDLSHRIAVAETESELGQLARLLNTTFARLETAFANQARFTSDASHELRTPLAVILSQTQTALSRNRSGAEYREALEACQRAADRMRRLTESLLALTRLDAGQEPMRRDPFDLAVVLRESIELIRPVAEERRIEVRAELSSVECAGDAEHVCQVATNLLTNAVQFNHDGGGIFIKTGSVKTGSCGGRGFFEVRDTGEGIPSEDIPHIFERFYRVEKSRSRVKGRSGLGLAICKAIIDAHNGTIEVSSEVGLGSVFVVRLPLAD